MRKQSLSQKELSIKSEITHQSLNKILQNKRTPSLPVIDKICHGLKCEIRDLFTTPEKEKEYAHNKEEIFNLVTTALRKQKLEGHFPELNSYEEKDFLRLVQEFGGWKFLYQYIKQELKLKKEATNEYIQISKKVALNMTDQQIAEQKRRLIVSRMILDAPPSKT